MNKNKEEEMIISFFIKKVNDKNIEIPDPDILFPLWNLHSTHVNPVSTQSDSDGSFYFVLSGQYIYRKKLN